jgi:uncharacterized coiled-coil protein SlyX
LLVSLIVFIYIIVVTARGWGVLHTILLCTLFIECWVFIAFSAGVHYRRVRATEAAFKAQEAAEAAEARTVSLLWGNFDASPDAQDAVVPLQGQLRRLTADRGRVWRQLNLLQSDPNSYQLQLSAVNAGADALNEDPDAAAVAATQPTSESLPVNTVVYAFAEEMNEEGRPIPVYYLGEFTVTQSQAGQVTLEPTLALYADQEQRITSGAAVSWTLYELLPLDSHTAFAAPGSQPSEEQIFGRMDEETITTMFAGVPADDDRQRQIVDSYLRDGQRASDNDPIEDVWVQVNVLKEYEIDVDSQEVANATERGYFDTIGRSVDSRLKRSEEGQVGRVKLTPDMRDKLIILKEEAARPLIDSGVVELVQRLYVRRLNDYEEAFNQHVVRSHEVSESIALFQRDSQEISKANQVGQEMISFRQIENQELQSDLSHYQKEIAVLNNAVTNATGQLDQLKAELSRMYRSVQARRDQLAEQVNVAAGG